MPGYEDMPGYEGISAGVRGYSAGVRGYVSEYEGTRVRGYEGTSVRVTVPGVRDI